MAPAPLLAVLAVGALLALLGYGLASNEPDSGLDAAVANGERPPAPELELPLLGEGRRSSLRAFEGRIVVLNYWASWCGPCRTEAPVLTEWHERLERAGAGTVLGVNVQDVTSDAADFEEEFGIGYPSLRDGSGESKDDFGVLGIPETFVLDREGRITAIRRGPVDDEFLREELTPLLREAAR